ncbi:unnamed protein product [Hymenolepis diminuta]|uniref:Hypoxanthine phosphoribosyltransferase n=1 Tax=Hymenolepis diminuta TaxID=6216 RepID=A0A0R3SCM4_HYMDI|nr:unnamed protein product [Hymenolepis diminuta]VUZ51410.1 unnamed protein product [Hymenolepis diminuta]
MQTHPPGHPVSVVVIPDNYQAFKINHFCISPKYQNYLDRLMIPNGLIKDRIEKVASEIVEYFEKGNIQHITVICVLKGGFRFFADLVDAMERTIRARGTQIQIKPDFVRIRSYVNASSGDNITLTGVDNPQDYRGKNILIIEDIIDTGKTMTKLHAYLKTLEVNSINDVSLLVKRTPLSNGYRPRFAGFEIPDHFVVGYALDYNDFFRDLHHICVINSAGMEHFAVPEDKVGRSNEVEQRQNNSA